MPAPIVEKFDKIVRAERRRRFLSYAVDVMTVKAFRSIACRYDSRVADEQMIEALLSVGHNHVARFQKMFLAILTVVILETFVFIAAARIHVVAQLVGGEPEPGFEA